MRSQDGEGPKADRFRCRWFVRGASAALLATALPLAGACSERKPVPACVPDNVAPGARPPASAGGEAPAGPRAVFAMSEIFLGDLSGDGTKDWNAWKTIGYNQDGVFSTGYDQCACEVPGAVSPVTAQLDGEEGIDNSFGLHIVGIVLDGLETQAAMAAGDLSTLFVIGALGPAANYRELSGRSIVAAPLGSTPALDGSDVWPRDEALSPVAFEGGYLVDHVAVLTGGVVTLRLRMDGFTLPVTIHDATVVMELDEAHENVTDGTIAGVVDPEELWPPLWHMWALAWPGLLCDDPAHGMDYVAGLCREMADALPGGVTDAKKVCRVITAGIGFRAVRAKLGPAVSVPADPEPCTGP